MPVSIVIAPGQFLRAPFEEFRQIIMLPRGPMPVGSAVARPGTGARVPVVRPATGARRLGTAAARNPDMPVGLVQNVQVQDRPVTKYGMAGMRTVAPTGGSRRAIADAAYYIAEIRSKMKEIEEEKNRLRKELEQRKQDTSQAVSLERQHARTEKEVIELEKQLADLNLLVEKIRADADVEDILNEHGELKNRNDLERKRLDAVFTERSSKERTLRNIESQIAAIESEQENRLDELGEDAKKEYLNMVQDNEQFLDELDKGEAKLRDLTLQFREMNDELQRVPAKDRYAKLQKMKREQETRMKSIQEASERTQRSVPEEREYLLNQVKSTNQEILKLEQTIVDTKSKTEATYERIEEVKANINEYSGERTAKYRELLARDKEMSEFINAFPEAIKKDNENVTRTEERIVMLLSHVSQEIQRANTVPNLAKGKFNEVQEDLNFKQKQMDLAKQTSEQLAKELLDRKKEAGRIADLDERIALEIEQLENNIQSAAKELEKYKDVETLRANGEKRRSELIGLRQDLIRRSQSLKHLVGQQNVKYESVKKTIMDSDTANELEAMEQKLRHHRQANFLISEFIENKTKEHDYEPSKGMSIDLLSEINNMNMQNLSRFKTLAL